jgi:hypothetical protein
VPLKVETGQAITFSRTPNPGNSDARSIPETQNTVGRFSGLSELLESATRWRNENGVVNA